MIMRSLSKLRGSPLTGVCLAIAICMLAGGALAGEIKLSTVRLDLSDRQTSTSLTLTNADPEKTVIHLRALLWNQSNGHDAVEPTDDLIINPPIAEIASGASQLVRIGYRGKLQTASEKSYRLLVEEVPQRDREHKQVVETYLKISVPIFIAPLDKPEAKLTAAFSHDMTDALVLHNAGAAHIRVVKYGVSSGGAALAAAHQGLFYVLPGANLLLPLDPHELKPAASAVLDVMSDEGPMQLPLAPASE